MLGISRIGRFTILVVVIIILPSVYLLYPHPDIPRAPDDTMWEYEAGGVDSPHWRDPVKPDFETEEARGVEEAGLGQSRVDGGAGGNRLVVEDEIIGSDEAVNGGVIMPKLENATAKAELGRAAWRVLHLMTMRYPENPSKDDRSALKSYFHLFSRLYPCGECAAEFQALLKAYPPQTSSRKSASMWLCHVHNLINERLGKPEFDCLTLNETYDCGCGPEPEGQAVEGSTSGSDGEQGSEGRTGDGPAPGDEVAQSGGEGVDRLDTEGHRKLAEGLFGGKQ